MSAWSEKCGEGAIERWRNGDTAAQIAKWASRETGLDVSRNAIIGYIARKLGKSAKRSEAATPAYGGRQRLRAPEVKNTRRSDTASARNIGRLRRSDGTPKSVEPPKPLPDLNVIATPSPGMVRPLELERHHCRWPIGDPRSDDFTFCGARNSAGADGGSWYCPGHQRASANSKVKGRDGKGLEHQLRCYIRPRAA